MTLNVWLLQNFLHGLSELGKLLAPMWINYKLQIAFDFIAKLQISNFKLHQITNYILDLGFQYSSVYAQPLLSHT